MSTTAHRSRGRVAYPSAPAAPPGRSVGSRRPAQRMNDSDGSSPAEQLEQQHDGRDHEKQPDQAAADVADQSEQPEDQQDDDDRPEHRVSLLLSFRGAAMTAVPDGDRRKRATARGLTRSSADVPRSPGTRAAPPRGGGRGS